MNIIDCNYFCEKMPKLEIIKINLALDNINNNKLCLIY